LIIFVLQRTKNALNMFLTWTETDNGTVNVAVKGKYKPAKMSGRTTQRTLSPERTPFKLGLTNSPIAEGAQKSMNQPCISYVIVRQELT
jgi:hypothetical protein